MDKSQNQDCFGIFESEEAWEHQNAAKQEFSSTRLDQDKMNQKTTKVFEQTSQASEEMRIEQRMNRSERRRAKKRTKEEGRRQSHRWSNSDHKKYIHFFLKLQKSKTYLNLSWKCWKPSNIYPQAAEFIGVNKEQVKSYDERMKNTWLPKQKDLMDFVKDEARKMAKEDDQIGDVLHQLLNLQNQKSDHMCLLESRIAKIQRLNMLKPSLS